MKRFFVICIALVILVSSSTAFAETVVDAVSTASTGYAFANFSLSGDALMDAINEKGGVTGILTTDKNGMPNIGLFGYDMVKQDEQYIICVHMMTNQTSINIDNGSEVVVLFADMDNAFNDEGRMLSTEGARIYVDVMEDQEAAEKLCVDIGLKKNPENGHLYAFVVKNIVPLG